MKKYNFFLAIFMAVMVCSSCSDWLDVRPAEEVRADELFKKENGYRTALNGIYRKMVTADLYGSNLSWGLVDGWGLVYDLTGAPDFMVKPMKKLSKLQFENSELVPTLDAMWDAAWNVIANSNELILQVENADSTLFSRGNFDRMMILGEATALRALMHFDLLRLYAPAPSMNPGKELYLPYIEKYPNLVRENLTVEAYMNKVIEDLKRAQEILKKVDSKYDFGYKNRFNSSKYNGEKMFLGYRGYRLNYYAVTGLLARAYLYNQQDKEAYEEAKKVIAAEQKKGFFRAVTSSYMAKRNIQNGDVKLLENIIFGLYCTDLTDWDQQVNHASDNASNKYKEYYLSLSPAVVNDIFGKEKEKDFRFLYQLEEKYHGFRTLKYYKQSSGTEFGETNDNIIPMIRMSEIYYIAAEAIYDQNKDLAVSLLQYVKRGRGIDTRSMEKISAETKGDFINALLREAKREWFGEGQVFFMYKRLNKNIEGTYNGSPVVITANKENMVLPVPNSEKDI